MVHILQNEEKEIPSNVLISEDVENFVAAPDLKVQLGTYSLDAMQEGKDYVVARLLEYALAAADSNESQGENPELLRLLYTCLSAHSTNDTSEDEACECEPEVEEQATTPEQQIIEELEHENRLKDIENERLREHSNHLEEELARLRQELEQKNQDNAALKEKNARLKAQKRKNTAALRTFKAEKTKLETQMREKENHLQMERNRTREQQERIKILEARAPARKMLYFTQSSEQQQIPMSRAVQKKNKPVACDKRNDR